MSVPLFELEPGARRGRPGLKARRTARQRFLILAGYHPLALTLAEHTGPPLKLHPNARVGGMRCGNCRFIAPLDDDGWGAQERKCWINFGERVTRGDATTVRQHWPGCVDWRSAV